MCEAILQQGSEPETQITGATVIPTSRLAALYFSIPDADEGERLIFFQHDSGSGKPIQCIKINAKGKSDRSQITATHDRKHNHVFYIQSENPKKGYLNHRAPLSGVADAGLRSPCPRYYRLKTSYLVSVDVRRLQRRRRLVCVLRVIQSLAQRAVAMAFTTEEEEKRPRNLAIPMKLDAFVFNRSLCTAKDKEARIVPITQYNYTFLRMEDHIVQSDLLPHADLHYSARPETNPRFTDLGRQTTRTNRLDVYLHWVLPRAFRSGTAGTPIQDKRQPEATAKGISDKVEDPKAPVFPQAPNRWLVVRRLDPNTTELKEASIQPVEAWIIESDRMRTIDKLGPEVDVQVDVALFITSYLAEGQDPSKVETKKQAEVFIGVRTPVDQ
ncbi:hypothetical protein ACMFMF_006548 [Clarireedia jacksonii]